MYSETDVEALQIYVAQLEEALAIAVNALEKTTKELQHLAEALKPKD